jgi:hypothetical protein
MKAAVIMLLMINGNYTVDVTPIYFQTVEACEFYAPHVKKQVEATRSSPVHVNIQCYVDAGYTSTEEQK